MPHETGQKSSVLPKRGITEAIDECFRELETRRRIYGRWVKEQKISYMDAKNRGECMEAALAFLLDHPLCPAGYEPKQETKDKPQCPF